ncbi:MAG: cell division protein SepF [Lachnospiraceae bacterium]|jgi:cell division inhibitor SepF|nr:cell division protein SepF [Lachnospiraceae bacterium]
MSFLDTFMDILKLRDSDDDDNGDYFDDDDYDYDDRPKKKSSVFGKSNKRRNTDYDDDYDDYDEEPVVRRSQKQLPAQSKVTPMRAPAPKRTGMEVCVIRPNTFDDAKEIAETLLSGRTVIVNMEGVDVDDAQRAMDFTSGCAYAVRGNLQRISNHIFLATPPNVDISGDLQDLLNSSFAAGATAKPSYRAMY